MWRLCCGHTKCWMLSLKKTLKVLKAKTLVVVQSPLQQFLSSIFVCFFLKEEGKFVGEKNKPVVTRCANMMELFCKHKDFIHLFALIICATKQQPHPARQSCYKVPQIVFSFLPHCATTCVCMEERRVLL